MRMTRGAGTFGALAASLLVLGSCSSDNSGSTEPFTCTPGTPVTFTTEDIGTKVAFTIHVSGVTITGSAAIDVLDRNSIGIVGGARDQWVDGTEWIRFSFDDPPVTEVSFNVNGNGEANNDGVLTYPSVEAFDRNHQSLGTTEVPAFGDEPLSDWFGGEPLSSFVIHAEGDGTALAGVTYSPCG